VVGDQIRIVPSPDPEATASKVGERAQSHILEVWPDRICRTDPLVVEDIRNVPSLLYQYDGMVCDGNVRTLIRLELNVILDLGGLGI
jgi:hypothetical protein